MLVSMREKIVVSFLTNNPHKFIEAREALSVYPCIELKQIKEEKAEYKDDAEADPIKEIAKRAAEEAVKKYAIPIAVEDTGIFFNAYPQFPGLNTKWVIKQIGYDGILRLLSGKDRTAYFRSIAAFCQPGEEAVLFEGRISGRISEEVMGTDEDCMDYDRIFIPSGETRPFSLIMEEKRQISHRKIAFQKLGEYLRQKLELNGCGP
jgi:XTP/dITP diphosphohydrolase